MERYERSVPRKPDRYRPLMTTTEAILSTSFSSFAVILAKSLLRVVIKAIVSQNNRHEKQSLVLSFVEIFCFTCVSLNWKFSQKFFIFFCRLSLRLHISCDGNLQENRFWVTKHQLIIAREGVGHTDRQLLSSPFHSLSLFANDNRKGPDVM